MIVSRGDTVAVDAGYQSQGEPLACNLRLLACAQRAVIGVVDLGAKGSRT